MYHSSECLWSSFHSWDIAEFSGAHFLIGGENWHPLKSASKVETLVYLEPLGFDASREHLFIWSLDKSKKLRQGVQMNNYFKLRSLIHALHQ